MHGIDGRGQRDAERKGINPFTKEPKVFKAKPARKIIRARPVKAAKDAVS
jgi:DNA-binding protein HU-beta